MRYLFFLLCIFFNCFNVAAKPVDTLKIYFDLGKTELKPSGRQTLDSLLYNDILIAGKKFGIIGYADYVGGDELNVKISESRAKAVQDYLISMHVRPEDIQVVIGRGEVKRSDTTDRSGFQPDRRVDIIPGGIKGWKPPVAKVAPPTPPATKIDISKVQKNEAIRLNKIFFFPGSHRVREESLPEVDNLYTIMKDNPKLKIRIEGHICCLTPNNTDGYDYDSEDFHLSTNRAKAIYDILVEKGIDESRMEYRGFGKSRPLVNPERSTEDENMNRRVEIRILDK